MTKGATHDVKVPPKVVQKPPPVGTTQGASTASNSALVDIPSALFTTDEGDVLPATVVADWYEPFELKFGARTSGYGDVNLQVWVRYLGPQQPEKPGGDEHLFEFDPGVRAWGKPHARRLNTRIIHHDSLSITLDVYNDGSTTIELSDEVQTTARGTRHLIHTDEHDTDVAREGYAVFELVRGAAVKTPLGGKGTLVAPPRSPVAPPDQADDEEAIDEVPTSMLLQQALGRLFGLKVLLAPTLKLAMTVTSILESGARFDEDLPRSTPAGDDPGLRARTRRLLEMLVYLGPVFERLAGFSDPEAYIADVANDAIFEVHRIAELYGEALVIAFGPTVENMPFAAAEKAMEAFPDWLTGMYLRDKRGVRKLIEEVASLEKEYREWFDAADEWKYRSTGMRLPEEVITGVRNFGGKRLSAELADGRDRIEQAWRDERPDILEQIAGFYSEIQLDIALLTVMVVQLQVATLWRAMSASTTSSVLDAVPFKTNRDHLAREDYVKLQQLIEQLVAVFGEKDGEKRRTLAQDALKQAGDALKAVQPDIEDFQDRLKWVDRINIVGKLLVIVAAAALTGGAAGSLAFAGARAAGAGLAYALAGEALVGGLVFTVTSRIGNQMLIGGPEGSFVNEWFWNSLTLGFMKLVGAGYSKLFTLPEEAGRFAKISYGLGNAATAMVSLHGFGELQFLISNGKWMSGDERVDAIFQNVALMVGLEAGRFITEPLQKRLTEAIGGKIVAKLGDRVKTLEDRRAALKGILDGLARGEASPAEIKQVFDQIEGLWRDELELLVGAAKRGVIDSGELQGSLAGYRQHIAAMELRLSQLNIKPPAGGPSVFRPLVRGFVAFAPEGRAQLERFYNPNDPNMPGKSLTESKTMPGVLEGRLPTGEITYYVPEGTFPPGIHTGRAVIAARDAAVLVTQGDAVAKQGLDRLKAGLAGGKSPPFEGRMIDELIAMVAPENVHSFLAALADAAFTSDLPFTFYSELAQRPRMAEVARAYGGDLLIKFYEHFGWGAECEQAIDTARWKIESTASPAARAALLAEIKAATPAALDQLVVEAKTLMVAAAEAALERALPGKPHPKVELVPRDQLGNAKVARVVVEHGKVTTILIDENASPASVREEVRHVMQSLDPSLAHLFAELDLGKPYAQYTPHEKLAAHKAAVAIELAEKADLIAELEGQTGPVADDQLLRALDDINNLRGKQLELERLGDTDLTANDLPRELATPANLHAMRTIDSLRADSQWSKLSVGEFRKKFLGANPDTKLTLGEIESYHKRFRLTTDRIPSDAKFDVKAKLGPEEDLPLTTSGERRDDALLMSKAERAQLDKLLSARDAARRRRADAQAAANPRDPNKGKGTTEYKRWDQKVREASHEIGERALDTWAKQRAWQDGARPSLYYRAESSRSGDFDAIHTWERADGTMVYLVGEGKGASAELGGRWIGKGTNKRFVQQGSKPYFKAIAQSMADGTGAAKKAGENLLEILDSGKDVKKRKAIIIYEKVQVPVAYESAPQMKLGERSTTTSFVITPFGL